MTNRKRTREQDTPGSRHNGVWRFMFGTKRRWGISIFAGIALTVLVFSLASVRSPGSATSNKNLSTFSVRRDDLPVTVTENGSIKARNSIDIKSEVEGRTTIISIVPEGTYVTQEDVDNGKLLVELDSSELTEQLAQREIDFASAEASYAEAKEGYTIQVKQNESDITAAKLKVKFSLMDFKKYLGEALAEKFNEELNQPPNSSNDGEESIEDLDQALNPTDDIASLLDDPNSLGGSASQKWKELNDNITLADSKYKRAYADLTWTEKLFEKKYVAETELEADRLEVQSLKFQRERAGIALELFKLYEFPKEAEKLLSDYQEAERELERTHARARSRLAQALAKKKSTQARFNLRNDRLNKTKRQIKACTIKAPAPGLVVYSSSEDFWRHREGPIEAGTTVRERQKIISLPNTTEMIVEIAVHESYVDKVRPGQTAKIVIDAFPDKTFKGEVLKVAPMPDPQRGWLSPDLKVYTTQVSIEGTHDFLKPGMSAKAEILVEHLEDVVIVPVQVVANRDGKKVCYVATPKASEQRKVQTGAFNDTFVQITDGLQVGEEVLMTPPRLIEPSAVVMSKQQRPSRNGAKQGRRDVQRQKPAQDKSAEDRKRG